MGAKIYIFFPFSLFVSVYVYASVCYFICIALLLPFVLEFCPSVFWVFLLFKVFFLIIIFYFNYFILFYFILFYLLPSFLPFLSLSFIFSPFYSEPCGGKALGAPTRRQDCASERREPTSGHWSTRDLPAASNIK